MIDDRFQILPSDDEDKTYVQLDGEVYYIDDGDEEEYVDNDLGEVLTTWKEDGEIEVNYLRKENKGILLTHGDAPELTEEALSCWDVFLRFRNDRVEVMFGSVAKRKFLPDDDPHYYDDPLEGLFN